MPLQSTCLQLYWDQGESPRVPRQAERKFLRRGPGFWTWHPHASFWPNTASRTPSLTGAPPEAEGGTEAVAHAWGIVEIGTTHRCESMTLGGRVNRTPPHGSPYIANAAASQRSPGRRVAPLPGIIQDNRTAWKDLANEPGS
jgi:hypothetical protein